MVCKTCRERHHDGCRGGTWCDCQHVTDQPGVNWQLVQNPEAVVVRPDLKPIDC